MQTAVHNIDLKNDPGTQYGQCAAAAGIVIFKINATVDYSLFPSAANSYYTVCMKYICRLLVNKLNVRS